MKRAQLRMAESIIILFIFFILLTFGIIFYAKISIYTGEKDVAEAKELSAENLRKKVRFLSEIQCTEAGNVEFDCYDLGKIKALKESIATTNYDYYAQNVFLQSNISFTGIYPDEEQIQLYAAPPDSAMGAESFQTPVTLYNPINDTYNFGYITIMVYIT